MTLPKRRTASHDHPSKDQQFRVSVRRPHRDRLGRSKTRRVPARGGFRPFRIPRGRTNPGGNRQVGYAVAAAVWRAPGGGLSGADPRGLDLCVDEVRVPCPLSDQSGQACQVPPGHDQQRHKDDPTDAQLLLDYLAHHREHLVAWKPDDACTRHMRDWSKDDVRRSTCEPN